MTEITNILDNEAYPPMPPKVAAAVAAVMGDVPKLAKGEKNSHGNYNFASIDDFLEAVRPLCAKSGLIIIQDEESFEMREGRDKYEKPVSWLVVRFRFTLAHASGETWAHRPARTIMVNAAMGSQAFGSAQSYALKQFERSLFQIATGESGADDADSHKQDNLPAGRSTTKTGASPSNSNGRQAKPDVKHTVPLVFVDGLVREFGSLSEYFKSFGVAINNNPDVWNVEENQKTLGKLVKAKPELSEQVAKLEKLFKRDTPETE